MSFQLLGRPAGEGKKGRFKRRREERMSSLKRCICEISESCIENETPPTVAEFSPNPALLFHGNVLLDSSHASTCYIVFLPPFGLHVYPSCLPGLFKAYLPMPAPPLQSSTAINQQQGWRGQTEEPLRLRSDCFSLSSARRLLLLQMDDGSG